jgi:biopolymer transport protein ExbB/TolQ
VTIGSSVVALVLIVMSVGALAIITEHIQKLARIKADAEKRTDRRTGEALEALRQEVAALRDTTTQYDLSFDAALQRLESRLGHVEERVARLEQQSQTQGLP